MTDHDDDTTTTNDDNDEEEPPIDFLMSMMIADDSSDEDDNQDTSNTTTTTTTTTTATTAAAGNASPKMNTTAAPSSAASSADQITYNSRKPLWWKKLSGKPSKGQKRAMTATSAWRLPKVAWGEFLDWNTTFPPETTTTTSSSTNTSLDRDRKQKEIWLEIGFGTGDNILALAERYPHRNYVGAEIHTPGIGKLCQRVLRSLQTNQYWNDYTIFSSSNDDGDNNNRPNNNNNNSSSSINGGEEDDTPGSSDDNLSIPPLPLRPEGYSPYYRKTNSSSDGDHHCCLYSNLRIYGGDGVKLLPYIPNHSLTAVLITFPDPFPKEAQTSFRILQKHTLLEIHRILVPRSSESDDDDDDRDWDRQCTSGGHLYLATDHKGHHDWCHSMVDQVNLEFMSHNRSNNNDNNNGHNNVLFQEIKVMDRSEWLPIISKYEQKGWKEGRTTHLSCWKAIYSPP